MKNVELDRESRRYIHIKMRNEIRKYDSDKQLIKESNEYNLKKCKKEDFEHT